MTATGPQDRDETVAKQLPLEGGATPARTSKPRKRAPKKATAKKAPRRPSSRQETDLDQGTELERRVGRVEFAEGAFVRLRTPVRAEADPGRDVLTDIDVLSVDVDLRLHIARSALECKSGGGQAGEPDRLFWLSGFRHYLQVERAVLVRETTSRRGIALARDLGLHVLDKQTLEAREAANAWLPQEFAHIGGAACGRAETRTDTQLRAIAAIPPDLVAFLRHGALLADSHSILGALASLNGEVARAAVVPEPAGLVIAGHSLIALILASLQDAGLAETTADEELRRRIELALVTGSPDDAHVLDVLSQADEFLRTQVNRLHQAYVDEGASRLELEFPSLRDLVSQPPAWVERYIDFISRIRNNPTIARDILQTAELAVFDALVGGDAWKAEAFNHLFTPEHGSLVSSAVRLLADIVGGTLGDRLAGLRDLGFDRATPTLPARRESGSELPNAEAATLAQEQGNEGSNGES